MKVRSGKKEIPFREDIDLATTVVRINRCATVVKGGRRFSFSAMVAVGNRAGVIGFGFGKANEVPPAVEKAEKDARKHLYRVSLAGDTVPHQAIGVYGAARVILIPAAPGTGVIAGASVRSVVDLAGLKNVLTKSFGTANPVNLVKATVNALISMRTREEVEALRGVSLAEPSEQHKEAAAEAKA